MHLVGFVTRIYHDARSPERQILENQILYEMWCGTFVKVGFGSRCFANTQRLAPADSNLLITAKTQRTLLLQAGFRKFQDVRSGEEANIFF